MQIALVHLTVSLVRFCAGGDQRWSSLPQPLGGCAIWPVRPLILRVFWLSFGQSDSELGESWRNCVYQSYQAILIANHRLTPACFSNLQRADGNQAPNL